MDWFYREYFNLMRKYVSLQVAFRKKSHASRKNQQQLERAIKDNKLLRGALSGMSSNGKCGKIIFNTKEEADTFAEITSHRLGEDFVSESQPCSWCTAMRRSKEVWHITHADKSQRGLYKK